MRDHEEDRDAPQDIDLNRDDDETINCPECGHAIHEDCPRCPRCGCWIEEGGMSSAGERSRGWFWPVMVALLVGVILSLWNHLGK